MKQLVVACLLPIFAVIGTVRVAADAAPTAQLAVPAATAYFQPDIEPTGTDVSPEGGVTGWADAKNQVVWYGQLAANGPLQVSLSLHLPPQDQSRLRLTVAGTRLDATATGSADATQTISFGTVPISKAGVYRFVLSGMSRTGATFGDLKTLLLSGPPIQGAHFSQAATRGAPSVHLFYQTAPDDKIAWFYNEVTAKADPICSYYMACGFSRGYFGMQVNSPTERRVIFSVWDSGKEPTDRSKVLLDDQVQLIAKGTGVFAGGFGNEGTGGHSHLVYPWKTGQTYRFLVSAQPDGTGTIYSGYFFFPEKKAWGLIASFRAPKDGGYLHGLYSFNEDFNGANGFEKRLAEFGPQWVRLEDGQWKELTTAKFSCTADGRSERLDRTGGAAYGRFFLSNGGFIPTPDVKYGDLFNRTASGKIPVAVLPSPPQKTALAAL